MFSGKIEARDIDKMDPEYRDLLERVLTIQADCEIGGPHLYVEKMLGLKRRSNEHARADYINEVNPILVSLGLKIPDPLKGRRYL